MFRFCRKKKSKKSTKAKVKEEESKHEPPPSPPPFKDQIEALARVRATREIEIAHEIIQIVLTAAKGQDTVFLPGHYVRFLSDEAMEKRSGAERENYYWHRPGILKDAKDASIQAMIRRRLADVSATVDFTWDKDGEDDGLAVTIRWPAIRGKQIESLYRSIGDKSQTKVISS